MTGMLVINWGILGECISFKYLVVNTSATTYIHEELRERIFPEVI